MNSKRRETYLVLIYCFVMALLPASHGQSTEDSQARALLVELVLGDDDSRASTLEELANHGDPIIATFVAGWRGGQVLRDGDDTVLLKIGEQYTDLLTGVATQANPENLKVNRPSRKLRKTLKRMVDLIDLSSPDLGKRIQSAQKLGLSQNPEYLPDLKARAALQTDAKVKRAFNEAVWISELSNGTEAEKLEAIKALGSLKSFPARDFIERCVSAETEPTAELKQASQQALQKIDSHRALIDVIGTLFRGLSLGSVLLLVAYGLAITFGQMGVINMAHGEFIAVGGYTAYMVQNWFGSTYGEGSPLYGYYFLVAIPLAFLAAAVVGAALERGLIRFLYTRPLESLLATWGISMILQQSFRLYFGAANVSVSSPPWLAGSLSVGDFSMSNSRVALIVCVLFVVIGTRLLLTKTHWGLHVRATMQNRQMASCLGVPSGRVNMITFAFGSGLAGLAGAFLSQIGNVGPSMGQTYIVDSFMVVVVGGVGNLLGAAISSMGIGMVDQGLQPILGPVMGKITVLLMIILFLQVKPGGLFPARSRSLDD